ncbi:MAG TPA: glycosyltransferase [Candidatus Margulisiibacteriota bacterium]|nr:glycosyltransferase [Candidatus Margulisiibacteriota bacterium]
MRVLHVAPSFYPAWAYGGIPRCAYELCRELVRLGVEVTAWTTDACDATSRVPERAASVDGITIRRFPNASNWLAYHRQLYLPRGLASWARRQVDAFDLVHLHSHRHLLQPLVANPARAAGVPYVFTGNGTVPPIERYLSVKRLVDVLGARAFLHDAAACIAVSQAETAHYRAAGVRAERVTVIPNGIRLDEFATLPARGAFRQRYQFGDVPLVVFVGKITPRKGVDVLLRALSTLPPDVHLAVVGNFMMPAAPIHQLVERLSLGTRVRFVGLLSGPDKLSAYVDADVTAYPSADEIFGLVPFESLMCGTPAVVCDDSGCGEWTRAAGGGLVVPYGEAPALAAALLRLLQNRAERDSLVSSGQRYIRANLSWEHVARQTLALYESLR